MAKLRKVALTFVKYIVITAFWIAIWQIFAHMTGNELLFPTPSKVLGRFFELASTLDFYQNILYSMVRVLLGALSAIVCGVILGTLTSKWKLLYELLTPLMTVIKSTPVSSFIILALVWMKRTLLPMFIVYLIVLPVVFSNVYEGIGATDKRLLEMTRVYKVSFFQRIRVLYIPSVLPYLRSAIMTSIGLAWKAGIAAEVLSSPAISIGKKLFEAKQYLETTDLFAWTLAVIIMSLLIELIVGALSGRFLSPDKKVKSGGESNA